MTMIFGLLKTWCAHRKMLDFYANSNTRAQETLSADSVEQFLCEEQAPVLIENGGICPIPFQEKQERLKTNFDSRIPTRS